MAARAQRVARPPQLITATAGVATIEREELRRGRALTTAGCLVLFVLFGVLVYGSSWLHGMAHTLPCGGCGDNGQMVWFIGWSGHAVANFMNPLRSNWIQFPYGADLANNTSMPLAGILSLPITLLFGPIASYNLLLVLAFSGSAASMFFVVRRWVGSQAAAFIAGLLYGFSPYMVGQGAGHLFELIAFAPPLVFLLLDEILITRKLAPWIAGVCLGALEAVQLGFSLELFADTALIAAIGVVVLAIARADVRRSLPKAVVPLGLAGLICAPVAAIFVFIGRTGPARTSGPIHGISHLLPLSSDLTSIVAPTTNQYVNLGTAGYGTRLVNLVAHGGMIPDVTENGAYIGIPLLLLLLLGLIKFRRNGAIQFVAVMAAISYLLSMGYRLKAFGHTTSIPLPFAVLLHLPLVNSEVASRYSLFMWLFAAFAIAIIVDQWLFSPARVPAHGRRTSLAASWKTPAVTGRVAPVVLLATGIVSLIPHFQYNIQTASVPAWFASDRPQQVEDGSVLLTYPFGNGLHNAPEMWQALNRFRYRIPDGEIATPKNHDGPIERAFASCWADPSRKAPPASFVRGAAQELVTLQVATVVVPDQFSINPGCAIAFLTNVIGRAPSYEVGSAVWRLAVPPPGQTTASGSQLAGQGRVASIGTPITSRRASG